MMDYRKRNVCLSDETLIQVKKINLMSITHLETSPLLLDTSIPV